MKRQWTSFNRYFYHCQSPSSSLDSAETLNPPTLPPWGYLVSPTFRLTWLVSLVSRGRILSGGMWDHFFCRSAISLLYFLWNKWTCLRSSYQTTGIHTAECGGEPWSTRENPAHQLLYSLLHAFLESLLLQIPALRPGREKYPLHHILLFPLTLGNLGSLRFQHYRFEGVNAEDELLAGCCLILHIHTQGNTMQLTAEWICDSLYCLLFCAIDHALRAIPEANMDQMSPWQQGSCRNKLYYPGKAGNQWGGSRMK